MKNLFTGPNVIILALSVSLSSFFSHVVTEDTIKRNTAISVVDLADISKRLMVDLQRQIESQEIELDPKVIEVMAQNKALEMFRQISKTAPGNVVMLKSNVAYSPDNLDITDTVAERLGLPAVTADDIDRFVTGKSAAQKSVVVGLRDAQ
jgi:hypothetical protein